MNKTERAELRRLCEAFQSADDACNAAWANGEKAPIPLLVEARTELDEYSIDLLPRLLDALDAADAEVERLREILDIHRNALTVLEELKYANKRIAELEAREKQRAEDHEKCVYMVECGGCERMIPPNLDICPHCQTVFAKADYAGNPPVTPERCQERTGATYSKKWSLTGVVGTPEPESS